MSDRVSIRDTSPEDWAALEALYPQAFPDEDLLPLLRDLLPDAVVAMSLVATIDGQVAGHVVFTRCGEDGGGARTALLAPLAVAPARQRRGIGSALVHAGLQRLKDEGVGLVCVLGDPAYYGRFGFRMESTLEAPYPLPEEWKDAWQSLRLGGATKPRAGTLLVPLQWREPTLWSP